MKYYKVELYVEVPDESDMEIAAMDYIERTGYMFGAAHEVPVGEFEAVLRMNNRAP